MTRSWSQEQVAVVLALAGVALMMAFALGVEVGHRAGVEAGYWDCAAELGVVSAAPSDGL